MKIKLYDERDFDYYNPKPFVLDMLSLFGEEDYKRLSGWIDNNLKYLFVGTMLRNDFLDTIKNNELDILVKEMKSVLDRKANHLEEEMKDLEKQIIYCQERIDENIEQKNTYAAKLEGLKNVIAKVSRADSQTSK
jgi:hypothetical protein